MFKSFAKAREIVGTKVRVKLCEARAHGDNDGCVCHLIGEVVEVGAEYESAAFGTPSFHLKGMSQRIRRSEVALLRKQ